MTSLALEHVFKSYGDVEAVRDASFEVDKGECIALLGPSGCGKSSTMRMIAGLEEVTRGQIKFGKQAINGLSPKERNVALAFESYALYSPLTVWENLAFPLQSRGFAASEIKRRVAEIAEHLQIEDLCDRMPSRLSGGQAQRVSLARALVREPNVMLLDEPLSHIDYRLRTELRVRIRRIHDETGVTMIYVTHDQEEAVALADRIIVMNHAEVQQIGDVQALWETPANQFVAGFLGEPAMNFLDVEPSETGFSTAAGTLDASIVRKPQQSAGAVLGFRPDRADIVPAERAQGGLAGEVRVSEFQGERCFLTVATASGQFKAIDRGDSALRPGDRIALFPHRDSIHLFDHETGRALQHGSQPA